MEFKTYIMGEWVKHDEDSCNALREYESTADHVKSPFKHMQQIADKYETTIDEMKKHRKCIERRN